ncbi:hypothetical protein AVEN_227010-1 [Araneus ventricosus]|uniref:Uncharacterized protein n=1 Tax=Araneus ventricosus TaxID=182803 RepID=A0A4Y2IX42_ARAVE|nr:hypothetical protein AVEN_227010-1 [Araneus ventricosus]
MFPEDGAVRFSCNTESEKKAINSPLQAVVAITWQSIQNVHFSQHRDSVYQDRNFPSSSIVSQRKCRHSPHRSTLQAPAVLQVVRKTVYFPQPLKK